MSVEIIPCEDGHVMILLAGEHAQGNVIDDIQTLVSAFQSDYTCRSVSSRAFTCCLPVDHKGPHVARTIENICDWWYD